MKIKKRNIIILFFGLTFVYNTYIPSWLITGSYTSSIDNPFATNGISNNESLEIFNDGTFISETWGGGTWELKHGFETRINFSFYEGNSRVGYNTSIYRKMFFSKPRIVIFRDLNSEFKKD